MSTIEPLLVDNQFSPSQGEIALWRSVILQAIWDAKSTAYTTKQYHTTEFDHTNSVAWLRGSSRDFIDVCHYAGIDPLYAREKIQELL